MTLTPEELAAVERLKKVKVIAPCESGGIGRISALKAIYQVTKATMFALDVKMQLDRQTLADALLSILPEIERMERIEAAAEEYCNVACDMNNFICRHHGIADGELYLEFLRLDDAQAIAKEKLREALTPTGATELLHTESDP